jgi:hypothetical protein
MLSVKAEPISFQLHVLVDRALSVQARQKIIADYARRMEAGGDAINEMALGHPAAHSTFVDGREGAAEETVNPDNGRIYYEWQLFSEVVDWIWYQIHLHSPIRKGGYRRSHMLFADGEQMVEPDPTREAYEWLIMSSVPYARKIERGESSMAPEGVYEAVSLLARQRFSNVASIQFTFRSFANLGESDVVNWARTRKTGERRAGRIKQTFERDVRQPAIVITFKGGTRR